jgi:endonuclease YncB( thermonuclease family)
MRRLLPLLLVLPAAAAAQTATDPAPLAAARAGFLREVLSVSQKLTSQYEAALARTEAELATAGGYEEALLIRRRRDELKALYPATEAEVALSLAVPLPVQQARLSGSVEARAEVLTNWRTNGSAAEWSGVRLTPGRYYLELEASLNEIATPPDALLPDRVRPQARAMFEFYELSLLPGAAGSRRSFEIGLNQDETSFTSVQIGPMQFTRSPVSLRLAAAAGYPGNQIRLRALRLIPAVEEAPTVVTPTAPEGPSLDTLRKSLDAALSAVQKPLADAYLARLRDLAQIDPALKDAAEAEERRVLRLLGSAGQTGGALRLISASSPLGAFDDLDGARYIDGDGSEGDRFEVEHEGRRLRVQLLWVLCAPVEPAADAARAKAFREHFRLDEQGTQTLGRLAQEFTAGYLAGKPLRLLVRPGRNKDGSVSALVFLPDVGLFQKILVDQGLAAVVPPKERRGVSETGLLDSLLERERAARRRKPAPGAWALSDTRP